METYIVDNPSDLPLAIFNLLFNRAKVVYCGEQVKRQVVTMRAGGTIKKAKVGDFVYLEQNPYKNSQSGGLAKAGHKIMWIIYEPQSKPHLFNPGTYVAKVMDGQARRLV